MYCLICESSFPFQIAILQCSCAFCQDCLSSWFLSSISSGNYHHTKCPNHLCHKVYPIFWFLNYFSHAQKIHFEALLLKKILCLDEDYVICQNPQCAQISFKPKILCFNEFRCPHCEWEFSPKYLQNGTLLGSIMDYSNTWLENASSGIYRDLFTRECPGCGISILKNGGCDHMSCRRCDAEFCWKCLSEWRGHRSGLCVTREMAKWAIITFVIILGGCKVGEKIEWDLLEVYGHLYYISFVIMNLLVAYYNFSLFLLFYLPFLIILYSIVS